MRSDCSDIFSAFWYDSHFCNHAFCMKKEYQESIASTPDSPNIFGMCQSGGAKTTKRHGMRRSGHKQVLSTFPFFSETWTGKRASGQQFGIEHVMWFSSTVRARFQRSQLKNVTVKIPSTCVKIGINDVIYHQNSGKWRHLRSNYRQSGRQFP